MSIVKGLKTMIILSLLIAINLILCRFFVLYITDFCRIDLGNVPIILSGLLFGPAAGAVTGGVADILGSAVLSGRGWFPPLTIGPVLMGFIPGLFRNLFRKKTTWPVLLLILFVTEFIASVICKTFILSKLYGTPLPVMLGVRVPVIIALLVAETLLILPLYKRLRKVAQ